MRVHIGPYKNWFGPYQLAEKILFWMDKDNDDRVHKLGDFFADACDDIHDRLYEVSLVQETEQLPWIELSSLNL